MGRSSRGIGLAPEWLPEPATLRRNAAALILGSVVPKLTLDLALLESKTRLVGPDEDVAERLGLQHTLQLKEHRVKTIVKEALDLSAAELRVNVRVQGLRKEFLERLRELLSRAGKVQDDEACTEERRIELLPLNQLQGAMNDWFPSRERTPQSGALAMDAKILQTFVSVCHLEYYTRMTLECMNDQYSKYADGSKLATRIRAVSNLHGQLLLSVDPHRWMTRWQLRNIDKIRRDEKGLAESRTQDGHWRFRSQPHREQVEIHAVDGEQRRALRDCLAVLDDALEQAVAALRRSQGLRWGRVLRVVPIIRERVSWHCGVLVAASFGLTAAKGATEALRTHYASRLLLLLRGPPGAGAKRLLGDNIVAMVLVELGVNLLHSMGESMNQFTQLDINAGLAEQLLQSTVELDLEKRAEAKQLFAFVKQISAGTGGIAAELLGLPQELLRKSVRTVASAVLLWRRSRRLLLLVLLLTPAAEALQGLLRRHLPYFLERFLGWLGVAAPPQEKLERDATERAVRRIEAGLSNFEDMRTHAMERELSALYVSAAQVQALRAAQRSMLSSVLSPLWLLLGHSVHFASAYLGGSLVLSGDLDVSEYASFVPEARGLVRTGKELLNEATALQDCRDRFGALEKCLRIVELVESRPTVGLDDARYPCPATLGKTWSEATLQESSIEFRGMSFGYPQHGLLWKDLSFRAEAGSFVGIVGGSGVGKTTLFRLLLRLYDVDSGTILLGGTPLTELQPLWLRRQMAVATQQASILSESLLANLVFGAEDRMEAIRCAAIEAASKEGLSSRDAQAAGTNAVLRHVEGTLKAVGRSDHFLRNKKKFPQKLHSNVSNTSLSPGEKKSISLVRALLKTAPILLLDEPTTGLDPATAAAVMNAMSEQLTRKRTIICITHQLSTVRNASRILFLADGAVAEDGSYDELIAKAPLYTKSPQCEHESSDLPGPQLCRHCLPASFAAFHAQQSLE